jgi:hypothetical protein
MRRSKQRQHCAFCEARLTEGAAFCKTCGHPTLWASHEEKIAWELEQYERMRPKTIDLRGAGETVAPRPRSVDVVAVKPRLVHPVRRRGLTVDATPERSALPEPVADPATFAVASELSAAAFDPAPPVVSTRALPADELPDADDPAMLLKIVRILNAKVADMEMRLDGLRRAGFRD